VLTPRTSRPELGDEIGSANNVTGRNNRATLCDTKCSQPRVPGREIPGHRTAAAFRGELGHHHRRASYGFELNCGLADQGAQLFPLKWPVQSW
jgi:hypothetical protein